MKMSNPRIAITGLGAVTPCGEGVNLLWQALLTSTSAISACDRFDLQGLTCTQAGLIRTTPTFPGLGQASRAVAFAASACREALHESGLLNDRDACSSIALISASNFGDMENTERALAPPPHHPSLDRQGACLPSAVTDQLAEALHLGGIRLALSLSCASGASAVATAANLLMARRARRILVVGYDAISPFSWSGLCSLRTMTKERVRPFDLHRSGTIFSEGAAALLLERLEGVEPPALPPLAYLTGWATGNNGFHLTAPAPRGAGSAAVMREALRRAGLPPSAIDHIHAHGTGTQPNDKTETQAIHDVFLTSASSIPVTSLKGTLGHLLGAAGIVEIVVSALSLHHQLIPPTANYETPDPACDLDIVTTPRTATLNHVLSNSAGFGGCNAAVILSKHDPAQTTLQPPAASRFPVYITGLGALCALGTDKEEITLALREGESACSPLTRFSHPDAPLAGEVPPVDVTEHGVARKSYLDTASALFLAATSQALQQAGINVESGENHTVGILAGTAYGCLETAGLFFADYLTKGPRLVKPLLFPHSYNNTPVSLAAMEWELRGEHENNVSADIASGVVLLQAFDLLASGQAEILVAGGVEALSLPRLQEAGLTPPLGEAAATLVLSREASAPCGQILACSLSTDIHEAVADVLNEAGFTCDTIEAVYANQPAYDGVRERFAEGILQLPEKVCGNVEGASSALHLCLGLIAGHQAPFLVLTSNSTTTVALLACSVGNLPRHTFSQRSLVG